LSLGATAHIDYEKQNFEEAAHDMDFVLDALGGEYITRSFKVLKPGGTIVSIPSGSAHDITELAQAKGLNGYFFSVRSNGENMREISELLQKGIIKSYVSKTFPFDDVQSAHRQIETKKTKGKLVLTV
jgi:NADPH:quinone reductase-like Zn-dependent oxidoreductase